MSNLINIGRVAGVYGIKGWVKIASQTEPPENIFDYQPWLLKTKHGVKTVNLKDWRVHGKGFVASIEEIQDRTQAELLSPVDIAVDKTHFPELDDGDYYWHQLIGCEVVSHYGSSQPVPLGEVARILPTGANDVLVVKPSQQSIDDKERMVPFVLDQYIVDVDLATQTIVVDWDPEF